MHIERYVVGPMENNFYLVSAEPGATDVVAIDPGFGADSLISHLKSQGKTVVQVLLTHAHLDHVAATARFVEEFHCSVAAHPGEREALSSIPAQAEWFGVPPPPPFEVTVWLEDQGRISVGGETLQVHHTPGHSPGHVCYLASDWAVVGDLIFAGSVGRADLPGGEYGTLMRTLQRFVLSLDDTMVLHPGHGPSTTVGTEKRYNPFLKEAARWS